MQGAIRGNRAGRIREGVYLLTMLAVAFFCGGCHTVKNSEPPRTLTEQLLLSTATDHALIDFDMSWVRGHHVYVEDDHFESYDKGYVINLIRQRLSESGALLERTIYMADTIVEIRSGALGMNTDHSILGIPAMGVPVPFVGTMQTPEIALYKSDKTDSGAKFAILAYNQVSGEYAKSTGPISGTAYLYEYRLLGIGWKHTDVPMLSKGGKVTAIKKYTGP